MTKPFKACFERRTQSEMLRVSTCEGEVVSTEDCKRHECLAMHCRSTENKTTTPIPAQR
jgi:hypothetical protein